MTVRLLFGDGNGVRRVDAVLFDKTGTLTRGEHVVAGVAATSGDEDALLSLAAAVEAESEHPLARAIVAAARERGDIPPAASSGVSARPRAMPSTYFLKFSPRGAPLYR